MLYYNLYGHYRFYRYTILREKANELSAIKRAEFVSEMEHLLGIHRVRALEMTLLKDAKSEFTEKIPQDSMTSLENDVERLKQDLADIRSMLQRTLTDTDGRSLSQKKTKSFSAST